MLFIPLVLTACDDAGSDSDTGPTPAVQFTATATNTTTTRTPNAAYQYVTFDIKSDVEVNVKLVLKEQGQPAPTRQEVLDGAGIYRALKTENKSLFLMYDINSKIKEYREALEASERGLNVIHDATAIALTVNDTGNDTQNVDALLLKQNTTYTLYALQSDGPSTAEVQTLIDLTTREFDSSDLPAANTFASLDFSALYYDSRDAALIFPSTTTINLQDIRAIEIFAKKSPSLNFTRIFNAVGTDLFFQLSSVNDVLKELKGMSLVYPSFSSTGGTSSYVSYNNINYRCQYVLISTHNTIDYDGYNILFSHSYKTSANIAPINIIYTFTKDQ